MEPSASSTAVALDAWKWASALIEQQAQSPSSEIPSRSLLSQLEQLALLHAAVGVSFDDRPSIRRVVAEVLGEVGASTQIGVDSLLRLTHDLDMDVRLHAVAAIGEAHDFAEVVVPRLVDLLNPGDLAIRQAAVWSLQDLGTKARSATSVLRAIALNPADPVRQIAIDALAWIGGPDSNLTELFLGGLDDAAKEIRAVSAYALGIGTPASDAIRQNLAARLSDDAQEVAYFCVWSLGRSGLAAESFVPAILHRLATMEWVNDRPSEYPTSPDLRETLRRVLAPPRRHDPELEDFRLEFFSRIFHPAVRKDATWISRIMDKPWLRKMLRRRFPKPKTKAERQRVAVWLDDARALFAEYLWKKPALGLTPERYRELPGFIKKYCLRVASSVKKPPKLRMASLDDEVASAPTVATQKIEDQEEANLLRQLVEAELEPLDAELIRLLYVEGCTISETAAVLKISESQVKTREKNILSALSWRLRLLR